MARKKHNNNVAVRITYYVESPNIRSHKKIKPHPFSRKPQTTRKCGYDRRAKLLAYANHLREADPETVHCCQNSKPKVTRGRWKYERMVSEEKINSRKKKKKKNSPGRSISQICNKLKSMLKEISFGGKCSKM